MKFFLVVIIFISFIGCSTLFVPQELSENYVLMPGVECDAPEAVDGDLNTVSNNTRIHISFPEKKSIRRIVIHSPNISNFIIYENLGGEGNWKIIKSFKGNTQTRIEINTQVVTDKIRIFITDTTGARYVGPGVTKTKNGFYQEVDAQLDARPQIQEIEIYGLVNKTSMKKSDEPLF